MKNIIKLNNPLIISFNFIFDDPITLFGKSIGIPTVNRGAVTMKTIKRTNITSTNGVTLISLIG